jgi:Mobilization protein NikA
MLAAHPRGGRPRTPNPRALRVNVRVAANELCEIERKATAAGISMSEYMRIAALGMTPDRRKPPRSGRASGPLLQIDPALFHELRRQGVNLHQIVKHLNIHHTPLEAFEGDVRELLARIRGIINRVAAP